MAGFFGAGVPSQELPEHSKKGYDEAPISVRDPAYRLKDLDRDGVQAEVIYTSMGMPLFGLDDAELRAACFAAFNDWAADYCSYNPKRLIPLGLITLEDIPAAVAELGRIAKKGVRGAMIWAEPAPDHPYNAPEYEPFWAAAQNLNMSLSLHILTNRGGTGPTFGQRRHDAESRHDSSRHRAYALGDGLRRSAGEVSAAENRVGGKRCRLDGLLHVSARHRAEPAGRTGRNETAAARKRVYPAAGLRDLHRGSGVRRLAAPLPTRKHHVVIRLSAHRGDLPALPKEIVAKRLGMLPPDTLRKIVRDTAIKVYNIED